MLPPDPASGSAGELPPDCRRAQRQVLAFLAGSPSRGEIAAMRSHLAHCVHCDELYRSEAVLLARLGRGKRRRSRGPGTAPAARAPVSATPKTPLPAAGGAPTGARRPERPSGSPAARPANPANHANHANHANRRRLRFVLLPVLVFFLMLQSGRLRETWRGFELQVLSGAVELGGESLSPALPPRDLATGSLCTTGPDARALIARGPTRFFLDGATAVVLESAGERRLHLGSGALVAHGPCTVVTPNGLIELGPGAVARVVSTPARIEIEALAAPVAMIAATGRRDLASGERGAFER